MDLTLTYTFMTTFSLDIFFSKCLTAQLCSILWFPLLTNSYKHENVGCPLAKVAPWLILRVEGVSGVVVTLVK